MCKRQSVCKGEEGICKRQGVCKEEKSMQARGYVQGRGRCARENSARERVCARERVVQGRGLYK